MGGKSSPSSVAPEHQRNENSVPFPACASEKSRSLYFCAASLDRCTESGSGQQNKVRNFVPTLCKGVAFRYSLFFALPRFRVSARVTPLLLRSCWGLGDKLTGRTQTPPQASQSCLAFPLVLFRKSRQNGSEGSTGLFWGGLTLG